MKILHNDNKVMIIMIILDNDTENPTVTWPRWWLMTTATGWWYNMTAMVAPNRTASSWYNMNTRNNDRGVRRGNAHANTPKKMADPRTRQGDTNDRVMRARTRKEHRQTNAKSRHKTPRYTRVGRLCRTKSDKRKVAVRPHTWPVVIRARVGRGTAASTSRMF
jgi:hypothetical protein